MTVYIEALKIFNEGKKYTIPKKGTDDYKQVIKIMNEIKANAPPKAPKANKQPKEPRKAKTPPRQKITPPKTDTTLRG